jgi:hypothetical protein
VCVRVCGVCVCVFKTWMALLTKRQQHTVVLGLVSIPQKETTRDDGTSTRHDSMARAAVFGAAVWCPGGTHVTCWR